MLVGTNRAVETEAESLSVMQSSVLDSVLTEECPNVSAHVKDLIAQYAAHDFRLARILARHAQRCDSFDTVDLRSYVGWLPIEATPARIQGVIDKYSSEEMSLYLH